MLRKYQARTGGGRKSVAAERYNPDEDDDEPLKVVPKTDSQRERLKEVSNKIMLLNRLDEVFPPFKVRKQEPFRNNWRTLSTQWKNVKSTSTTSSSNRAPTATTFTWSTGSFTHFCIYLTIFSGKYDVYINKENGPEQVFTYNDSGFFGELALMYNTPRAATVKCSKAGVIWSLVSCPKLI